MVHYCAHRDDVVYLGGLGNVRGVVDVEMPSMHAKHLIRRVGRYNLYSDARDEDGSCTAEGAALVNHTSIFG